MNPRRIVLFLALWAVGFGIGETLESVGIMGFSPIQGLIASGAAVEHQIIPLIKSAELSSTLQSVIDQASVGFDVTPMLIDPDGVPNSEDEYLDNKINVCRFHSDENIHGSFFYDQSIDDGVCIVCKLLDEEDPCVDIFADFTSLADEATETDINNALAADGITVSAQAFSANDPNTVIIFDSDVAHGTDDKDIEGTGVGGNCAACNGMHLVIIPEGTGDPPVPKSPADDSAAGGIQTWKFNPPRFVVSFVFADKDNGQAAEARAYSTADCSGDADVMVPIPNGNANDVDTIIMNADNVRCLEIEYPDSGGVTNFDLRCVEHDNVLGRGQIDLPLGYTASDTITIPIPDGVPVVDVEGVKILIQTVILDYSGLPAGTILNNQYQANFGITIDGEDHLGNHLDPQVFNTNANGTPDSDLEVNIGNISIIPHDDNDNGIGDLPANDSPNGGKQIFIFSTPRFVNSLVFVDADRGGTIGFVTAFNAANDVIGVPVPIPSPGDASTQVLVMMNTEKTSRLEVQYEDSGGVASINLGCPLPTDPLNMGVNPNPPILALNVVLVIDDLWDLHVNKDIPLKNHLLTQVDDLTLVNDEAITGSWAPPAGTNLIVVSESVSSSNTSELKDLAIGIVTVEGSNWDEIDLGTSGSSSGGTGTLAKILDSGHYITQNLGVSNGDSITIANVAGNAGYMRGWDAGTSQVKALAVYTSDETNGRILVIESGDKLVDGTNAPERRVFFGAQFFDNLNADGVELFDRSLLWASGLAG